mmetsp:Transcript_10471/g.39550  ORF Transcript_10471/g.39550 Transcript_10471/m.39550 type:complete len:208 (+) Transcript_10471:549-1172(+)
MVLQHEREHLVHLPLHQAQHGRTCASEELRPKPEDVRDFGGKENAQGEAVGPPRRVHDEHEEEVLGRNVGHEALQIRGVELRQADLVLQDQQKIPRHGEEHAPVRHRGRRSAGEGQQEHNRLVHDEQTHRELQHSLSPRHAEARERRPRRHLILSLALLRRISLGAVVGVARVQTQGLSKGVQSVAGPLQLQEGVSLAAMRLGEAPI